MSDMTKFLNLNDPSFLLQPWDTLSPEDVCDSENCDDGLSVPAAPKNQNSISAAAPRVVKSVAA